MVTKQLKIITKKMFIGAVFISNFISYNIYIIKNTDPESKKKKFLTAQ